MKEGNMEETESKDLVPLHEMLKIARDKTGNTRTTNHDVEIHMWLEYTARYGKYPVRVSFNQPMTDLYDESLQSFLEAYLLKMLSTPEEFLPNPMN
jgi:hypothetical protein